MNETSAEGSSKIPSESQARWRQEAACPMAAMCGGIFERGPSRFLLMIPGTVLILLGVAILVQPKVLIWLVAGVAVLVGAAMLLMANFIFRLGAKVRGAGR